MTDPAGRPTRGRENTRQRLFRAAAEVFSEIGVDAASVEVITERAGFTRGAFYSNFDSKDDLFFELMLSVTDHKLEAVGARVRDLVAEGLRGVPIDQILTAILDTVIDRPVDIMLLAEFRMRAMRDRRTAETYLQWQGIMESRMRDIVGEVAGATGLTLLIDAAELAQSIFFIWEGTSVQGVIEGRSDADLHESVRARTLAIVSATVMAATTGCEAD